MKEIVFASNSQRNWETQTTLVQCVSATVSQVKASKTFSFFIYPAGFYFPAFLLFRGLKKENNQEIGPCTCYFVSVFWDWYQRPAVCPMYVLVVIGFPVSWCDAAHVEVFLQLGSGRVMSRCPWADASLQPNDVCCDFRNKSYLSLHSFGMWQFFPVFLHGRAVEHTETWTSGHTALSQLVLTSLLSFRCFAYPLWGRLKPLKYEDLFSS